MKSMTFKTVSHISLIFIVMMIFLFSCFFVACTPQEGTGAGSGAKNGAGEDASVDQQFADHADIVIRLAYPEWSSEIASAHLMQAVLQERLGYQVQMVPVGVEEMWRQVAEGQADILTGAWLPTTHRGYYEEYGPQLEDLGPNLVGARIGLVVPTVRPGRQTGDSGKTGRELVTIRSIEELSESAQRFDGRIIGIESGAGVVARTREALSAYNLRTRFRVVTSDEERMLNRLRKSVQQGEWIVFTGWKPHWVFELYNLRFLEDPKGIFGGEESIHTMVRSDFKQDVPDAYKVLKQISYKPEDLERLMRWIHEDEESDPYAQAVRWIKLHPEMVESWISGAQ